MTEQELKDLVDYLLLRDRPIPAETPRPNGPIYSFNGYPRFCESGGYPANKTAVGHA